MEDDDMSAEVEVWCFLASIDADVDGSNCVCMSHSKFSSPLLLILSHPHWHAKTFRNAQ
jgi:hypothetical protein